jgi:hypothetical protein
VAAAIGVALAYFDNPHDDAYDVGKADGRAFAKSGDESDPDVAYIGYMEKDGYGMNSPPEVLRGYREGFKHGWEDAQGFSHSSDDEDDSSAQSTPAADSGDGGTNAEASPPQQPTDTDSAERRAVTLYPELGVANSALNREFLRRYHLYQAENPSYFSDPDWPTRLAQESAEALDQR